MSLEVAAICAVPVLMAAGVFVKAITDKTKIEEQIKTIDAKFEIVDKRLEKRETEIEHVEKQMQELTATFYRLEGKIDALIQMTNGNKN